MESSAGRIGKTFLAIGLTMSVLAVLLAYHTDNLLSPTRSDIQAPFVVLIIGCSVTLLAFLNVLKNIARRSRIILGIVFLMFGAGIPATMTLLGAALNVDTWTFYTFLPVVELLGMGVLLILPTIARDERS